MKTRMQILENETVLLDTYQSSKTDFSALHTLLKFEQVDYDPSQFYRRGDWVCYTGYSGRLYRTMSSKHFG